MKIVWSLARAHRWSLTKLAGLEIIGALLAVLAPIPLQTAVDVVAQHQKPPGWLAPFGSHSLAVLCVVGLLLTALAQAQSVGSGLLSTLVGQRIILGLRVRLFSAALRLSLGRHIRKGVADAPKDGEEVVRPAVGTLSRTKSLLLAALKVWELKNGIHD